MAATVALVAIVFVPLLHYVLRMTILSPLFRIPSAHPTVAVSSYWFRYLIRKNKELATLLMRHRQIGPIMRIGPNEVSVVSLEGLRKIYTGGFDKDPWYLDEFMNYDLPNLVSMLDHKTHSKRKRMITNVYSKSYLLKSKDMECASQVIVSERLLPLLTNFAKRNTRVNGYMLSRWGGVDLVTAYLFGLQNGQDLMRKRGLANLPYPPIGRENESSVHDDEYDAIDTRDDDEFPEDVCLSMCQDSLNLVNYSKIDHTAVSEAVVFSRLYSQMASATPAESSQNILTACASEMLDHIITTEESAGTTLTYIIYHLSLPANSKVLQRLREEFRNMPQKPLAGDEMPSSIELDKLPILHSVVMETLRLHAAAPCRQPRKVPAGGIELHGYFIPAGTTVSTNAYCLHRNEDVFPNSEAWQPERWLSRPDASTTSAGDLTTENDGSELKKWFWTFGSGGRMCIGSNFVMQFLKLFLYAIYSGFKTEIIDDTGIEQRNTYLAHPIGRSLIVKFTKMSRV